jgi:hypothetical protein
LKEQIMTKWTILAAVVALAAAAGVQAQSGGTMGMDKMEKPMGKAMTYTGCVTAGAQPGVFMLTNMMSDMGMKKDAMPTSMMLMGTKVDFSKHVDHKVTVTGMMDPEAMKKMDPMTKASTGMMVASMKMVGTSCGK